MSQSDKLAMKQKNPEQPKKSFFKRFLWVWVILGIGLAVFLYAAIAGTIHDLTSGSSGHKYEKEIKTTDDKILDQNANDEKGEKPKEFTKAQLEAANLALANGVRIDDPQNNFYKFPPNSVQPDGRPDNPNPYPLPWTDFKSVSFGSDQEYFYVKFQFWGEFPEKAAIYDGDLVLSTGAKIEGFTFINSENKEDLAELGDCIWFVEGNNHNIPAKSPQIGHLSMISPYGEDENRETLYKTMSGAGMIEGGYGYDYLLGAYPLYLFNLKIGDVVTFNIATETGSTKYHHEAADFILENPGVAAKAGATIEYVLGNNTFKNLGVAKNMIKEEKKY